MARTRPLQPEDFRFIEQFSQKLKKEYDKFTGSNADFARKLDVSRAALQKYLDGKAIPGIRTLVLAYENLGISVSYGKFDAKKLCSRGKKNRASAEGQMLLPFAIESLKPENLEIEFTEKKPNRIAMSVRIRFAS